MKTILLILVIITFNITLVSADNNTRKGIDGPAASQLSVSLTLLAPVAPEEATFEDIMEINILVSSPSSLAPFTPSEAYFEEAIPNEEISSKASSPVNQNAKAIEKGKAVHPDSPIPCDAKYGCSL